MQTAQTHLFIAEWRRLRVEEQRELARDIARAVLKGALARPDEEALARALKFRVGALRRRSEDGLAAAIRAGIVLLEARPFLDILIQVHFSSRAPVLSRTYDLLGVVHDGTGRGVCPRGAVGSNESAGRFLRAFGRRECSPTGSLSCGDGLRLFRSLAARGRGCFGCHPNRVRGVAGREAPGDLSRRARARLREPSLPRP